ncbi:MAG: glycosyltransferase family 2 protein [Anaerolineaceae bacterium]|nr:glycosyltransferase family 2 protein [Anaerolineaceae bacterium]
MTAPFLSIVIPAHNEEYRLPPSLQKIHTFIQSQPYTVEVLVIENGSHDRTVKVAHDFARQAPYLRVISETQRGKGLAVRRGMLEARGEYRFICDADLSMPIDQVNRFLPPNLTQREIIIGSREISGAVRYHEPAYRHFIGRGFNSIVRWMALPGLQDTQCGYKCFSARAAENVFSRQSLTGMSFDVEVLFIARQLGYEIQEVPIDWYFDPDSRVRLFKDSLAMFLDLLTIRRNARQGYYGPPVRSR